MTNLRELISKYKMYPFEQNGNTMLKVAGKPSPAEIKIIKTQKQAIIAECRKMAEEREEKMAEEREEKMKRNIQIVWHDGEYLSGYMALGNGALLETLGLAKYIDGWGYLVAHEVAEALGKNFTAEQAKAYILSSAEEVEGEVSTKERIETAIEIAKALGHKVEIGRYTVDCDGSAEECSTDTLVEYIDGNGEYSQERLHLH